jgi:hypothetical protein
MLTISGSPIPHLSEHNLVGLCHHPVSYLESEVMGLHITFAHGCLMSSFLTSYIESVVCLQML